MSVKSASNNVVVRGGMVTRRLTEKEVRRSLLLRIVTILLWGFVLLIDHDMLQRVSHGLFVIMTSIQLANTIDQLRRLRRGEIVEVTTRANTPRRAALVTATVVTVLVGVATAIIFHLIHGPHSLPMTILIIPALLWGLLLTVWYRILRSDTQLKRHGIPTQLATAETQTTQTNPTASAAPAHWWTQNAVRDDVQVQSVGNRPQTNDR